MEERKKRVIKQTVSNVINHETGEVLSETNSTTTKIEPEPDFVKLYFDDLVLLSGLPKSTSNIVFELIKYMTYSNEVILNSGIRKRIADTLGIIPNTLTHALKNLCDVEILRKDGANIYTVNPFLFGRGKWEDIKAIRLVCNYSPKGKKVRGQRNPPREYDIYYGGKNVLDIVEEQIEKRLEQIKQNV